MHNIFVNDFSNHIAIIGAGISGLTLGCILKAAGFQVVIFEKAKDISEEGAGISIPPNGTNILKPMGIYDKLKYISSNPKKALHYDNHNNIISSFVVDVLTTSRQTLYKVLLEEYLSNNGNIYFEHELIEIDESGCGLKFLNNDSYKVLHVAACDGINSFCRKKIFPNNNPVYSGYSVWRTILNMRSKEIKTYLGPKHHMVAYPINEDQTSLVAAIKTDKKYKESWRVKGTLAELKKDLVMSKSDLILKLDDTTDFYKWGVYTRPSLQTLYSKNITLLGDAAHPIVPFIGQGGCLALEDAYLFGKLIISSDMEFSIAQENYQKIRMSRIKKIKTLSERQGHLNHISNKLISSIRNFIMNHMQFIAMRDIKKIWEYDIDKEILKIK